MHKIVLLEIKNKIKCILYLLKEKKEVSVTNSKKSAS